MVTIADVLKKSVPLVPKTRYIGTRQTASSSEDALPQKKQGDRSIVLAKSDTDGLVFDASSCCWVSKLFRNRLLSAFGTMTIFLHLGHFPLLPAWLSSTLIFCPQLLH
jgi:hypothetical protein